MSNKSNNNKSKDNKSNNNKSNNNKSNNNKSKDNKSNNNNKPNNKSNNNNNKPTNNRFQILVQPDENTDTKPVKNDKILYDSSNNSFTKPSNFDRPRNNRIDDSRPKNNFKQREKEKEPVKEIVKEIVLTPDIFPELLSNNTNISQVLYTTNFKDILTKVQPEININKNIIKPGFVELTLVDRKIVTKYGPSTPSEKKNKAIEERLNSVDYCMNKVIVGLEQIWNNRKDEYDSINGEGSYDELYYLPQVYGPEYDNTIEDEEEDEMNPYDEYIYEDEYIE